MGITVLPYRWGDEGAAAYAEERDATLALNRLDARGRPGAVSLSPASLRTAAEDFWGAGAVLDPLEATCGAGLEGFRRRRGRRG